MVKAQAGILESDLAEEAEGKLRTAVFALIEDENDARRVQMQLRPLIGVAGEGELRGAGREEAFAAWRRFFEAMAERRPLVMVFEDLHWADDALLDFVDELVDWAAGVPLLVLVTARPELLSRRPGWGGGKPNAVTISLSPLSDEDTARLVHSLLGRSVLPAETQTALLERAGGNPLYAEEFVALVQERGLKAGEAPALPESVQGILAARLDSLSVEEKSLLQCAAVLGRVFWAGALAHVAHLDRREVEERLHTLERREFVRRERRPSVASETEYVFRHLLVRDVAYGQIPRRSRAELHRLAAEWIESLGRPDDHAELLAYHYLAALEYARASGQEAGALAGRAQAALHRAGDRALSLNAFGSAARFFDSALELTPADDPSRAYLLLGGATARYMAGDPSPDTLEAATAGLIEAGDRERAAEAELILGELHWRQAERDLAYQSVDRAIELLNERPASPAKARVLSEISRYHMLGGREAEAIHIGREALRMAQGFDLAEVQAHALDNIGTARVGTGDLGGIEDLERSIEIATEARSLEAFRARNNLGASLVTAGEYRRALDAWRPGIELAEQFRGVPNAEWIRAQRLGITFATGDWAELDRVMEDLLTRLGPSHYIAGFVYELRSRVRLARGDVGAGIQDAELALSTARRAKDPQRLLPSLAVAAQALLQAGRTEESIERVDELIQLDPLRAGVSHPVSPVLDLAWILSTLGRRDEFLQVAAGVERLTRWHEAAVAFVRGDVEQAVDVCVEIGVLPNEAYMRLRAAEKLLDDGRPEAAEGHMEKALEFYRSVGATTYIRQIEELRSRYQTPEAAS